MKRGMLEIIVSNSSASPIYEQIAQQIKDAILTGDLAAVSYTHLDVYKRQHVGSELLAWGNLEGDVHADGDEHARAQCLDCLLYTSRCV